MSCVLKIRRGVGVLKIMLGVLNIRTGVLKVVHGYLENESRCLDN